MIRFELFRLSPTLAEVEIWRVLVILFVLSDLRERLEAAHRLGPVELLLLLLLLLLFESLLVSLRYLVHQLLVLLAETFPGSVFWI